VNLDARHVRVAFLRAFLAGIVAGPLAGQELGVLGALVAVSLSVATIPLSLYELATIERRRIPTHVAAIVGAFVLVVGALIQSVYTKGVIENGSIDAGLHELESVTKIFSNPNETSVVVTVVSVWAAGVTASLWIPFALARIRRERIGRFLVFSLLAGAGGTLLLGAVLGSIVSIVFNDSVFMIAMLLVAFGAVPGCVLLPLVHLAVDAIEPRVWRIETPTTTPDSPEVRRDC
jgi:hypothetical protein